MIGRHHLRFPAAQPAAYSMVGRYGVDAVFVAQREVDTKIQRGDLDAALKIDRVRRELLDLIVTMEPPAHY